MLDESSGDFSAMCLIWANPTNNSCTCCLKRQWFASLEHPPPCLDGGVQRNAGQYAWHQLGCSRSGG
ncbi:hypothetical protein LSAT2_026199 [Lamellibrachia satsuma]|nr:hypothetical protein LSAT2_026199 [Lamellibrachia satsuma]